MYDQKRLYKKVVTDTEGKVHHRTGYEDPEGEERYSPTFSLTSKLDGVGGQCHAPADLLPAKRPDTH
jgi:hypothetical protein